MLNFLTSFRLILPTLVVVATILINLVLSYSGTTQKLVCTFEQTQAAAAAILSTDATH